MQLCCDVERERREREREYAHDNTQKETNRCDSKCTCINNKTCKLLLRCGGEGCTSNEERGSYLGGT